MTDQLRAAAEAALEALVEADPLGRSGTIEKLRAALAEPDADWSLFKATQESLREHMAEIQRLRAALADHENEGKSNCTTSQRMNPHFTNTSNPVDFPKSKSMFNERIKELALQAEGTKKHVPAVWQFYDHELEKFAELIVRECAELSVNSQYTNTKNEYYEGFNEALIYAGNKIRNHFGVE